MSTETRPKVKHNRFDFYADNGFRLLLLDNRTEIDGEPNPAYRKRPIATNWQKRKGLNAATAHQRMKEGFNIGAAIPETVLVIDVDTRNGGLESMCELMNRLFGTDFDVVDIGDGDLFRGSEGWTAGRVIDYFTHLTYSVRTSDKGHHFYFKCEPGLPLTTKLGKGIDVLSVGRQVVTPGSLHPKTGEIYMAVGADTIADIPDQLMNPLLSGSDTFDDWDISSLREDIEDRKQHSLWGAVRDPYIIERLLCALPPTEYSDYNQWWFPLLCACHHAMSGSQDAKEIFANWSSWDPRYADKAHAVVNAKWETVDQSRRENNPNVSTIRTLLSAAEKECKKLIVAGNAPSTLLRDRISSGCLYKDGNTIMAKDVTIEAVLHDCRRAREGIIARELVEIGNEKESTKLLQWIDSLKPGWEKAKPELKRQLVDIAAALNESLWPEIAAALSKASTYSVSASKIEKQIRANKKESLKVLEQEDYDLTQAELVEAVANLAMQVMVEHDGVGDSYADNIISPPNSAVYKYLKGRWSQEPHNIIEGICYQKVMEVADFKKKSTKPATDYADKALSTILKKTATRSADLYARRELPSCINLKNGTLWFSKDNPPEFRNHNRGDLLTTQLPYDYDPKATCPDFDTMLEQVFAHAEGERSELIRHFYELVGYMIQTNKDLPKILIWTGEGQNGKSRIAKTISKLVGEDAWLRTDFQQFFSDRQPHNMHAAENKLVIMDDDLRAGTVLNDGALKKVSETAAILVNPKNRDAYTIHLQLTPLIISNSWPRIEDISKGMIRRLDVIDWATNIDHLQDSPLPDRVDAEQIPGVLNRAIEGLARLRARGDFDPPPCSLVYRERFLEKSNTIYGFWSSRFKVQAPGEKLTVNSLYDSYKDYVRDLCEGRPVSRAVFRDNLRRCGVRVEGDYVLDWVIDVEGGHK